MSKNTCEVEDTEQSFRESRKLNEGLIRKVSGVARDLLKQQQRAEKKLKLGDQQK